MLYNIYVRAAGPDKYRVARCMIDLKRIRGKSQNRIQLAEKMRLNALHEVSWRFFLEDSAKSEAVLDEAFRYFHVDSLCELVNGFVTASYPYMLQLSDAEQIIEALQPLKMFQFNRQRD